jgi:ribosome-associated protein
MNEAITRLEDEALARHAVAICEDRKALNIKLFDVRGMSMITDFYLICSGNSEPHIRALSDHVGKGLAEVGTSPAHVDGAPSSRWIVMDFGTLLVHIFHPDVRNFYEIEKLLGEERLIYQSHQDDTQV